MNRRILVTGTCQVASIAGALQRIFPEDAVTAYGLETFYLKGDEGIEEIAASDFWVNMGEYALMEAAERRLMTSKAKLIKCPIFTFSAFHPDNVYLYDQDTGAIHHPHYNSRIAAWGYSHNILIEDVLKLYCRPVFADLGYFDHWGREEQRMRGYFEACEADFNSFFLRVKRGGVFMNTINHPKSDVLVHLAKVISLKMGASRDILDQPIYMTDALADHIWPVYPDIAEYYAVQDSYNWMDGVPVSGGLRGFVETAYKLYEFHKTDFQNVSFMQNGSVQRMNEDYDKLFFPHLAGS